MNIIQKILKESEAYTSLELIKSAVETGGDLTHFPIQPLYTVIRELEPAKIGAILPMLGKRQRQSFLDLDLWTKDDLDVSSFELWVQSYLNCEDDEIAYDFVHSDEFSLFLKGRFNIWTFDEEDPLYPDHDNYFITDDNLLLFEYEENFELADEVRELLRKLYYKLGVEKAYAHLFKLTSDSFLIYQEQQYEDKKYRLAEVGFVDYYDALDIESTFANQELLDATIRKRKKVTARIDDIGKKQTLHSKSLVAYRSDPEFFSEELSKVVDEKRRDFLQFNFIRMVNASITFNDALRDGQVALTRVGKNSKTMMALGFDYLKRKLDEGVFEKSEDESLFDYFDFVDLYRFGKTLVSFAQKEINKGLKNSGFDSDDELAFLGKRFGELIDFSFDGPPRVCLDGSEGKATAIDQLDTYWVWRSQVRTLCETLSFAEKFYIVYSEMKESGKISDHYYINYQVNDIDLEAVLISSFANYTLGLYEQSSKHKMGLTLSEFRSFVKMFFTSEGKLLDSEENKSKIESFLSTYGLDIIFDGQKYLIQILKDHLEGYDYTELKENDYKHVGGPIILDPGQ